MSSNTIEVNCPRALELPGLLLPLPLCLFQTIISFLLIPAIFWQSISNVMKWKVYFKIVVYRLFVQKNVYRAGLLVKEHSWERKPVPFKRNITSQMNPWFLAVYGNLVHINKSDSPEQDLILLGLGRVGLGRVGLGRVGLGRGGLGRVGLR